MWVAVAVERDSLLMQKQPRPRREAKTIIGKKAKKKRRKNGGQKLTLLYHPVALSKILWHPGQDSSLRLNKPSFFAGTQIRLLLNDK